MGTVNARTPAPAGSYMALGPEGICPRVAKELAGVTVRLLNDF